MKRFIMIGTGGFGEYWCSVIIDRIRPFAEMVAAVDVNEKALANPQKYCGLAPENCYTDPEEAMRAHPADFVVMVVPYQVREPLVDLAIRYGLDIVCEKPIAGDMDTAVRIYRKVKAAGRKLIVTMSHTYEVEKQTVRELVQSGRYGRLNYLMNRLVMRYYGGVLRDPWDLLIGGTVHNLDTMMRIAGAPAKTVFADCWNFAPKEGAKPGQSSLVQIVFENGVRASIEGSFANATELNKWSDEYIRAECADATIVADKRKVTLTSQKGFPFPEKAEMPLLQQPLWDHAWLIEQFVKWVDGGPEAPTSVDDSLQVSALLFAAVESAKTGQAVDVQAFLKKHLEA